MEPSDWLTLLVPELDKRATAVGAARDWYDGIHPIPLPPPNTAAATDREARLAFQAMSELAITNFLSPVADVIARKLKAEGFRSSRSATSTDVTLWDLWKRNHLVTDWPLATLEAVKVGNSCAIVWPGPDGSATITVEDPSQVIVAYAAGSRHTRAAALKRWMDDDGYTRANIYLPDGIYKYRSTGKSDTGLVHADGRPFSDSWEKYEPAGETWPVVNPWKVVPVVELRVNAPLKASRFGGGVPQFQKQITTQKRINHTVMGRLVTMESQSFRQRWATNWGIPTNPDGTPDRDLMIKMSAARIANFAPADDEKEVKVGEFAQADFSPFLKAVQEEVKAIATTSSTPPYAFLLGDMINVASDALARIEGTHIANVGGVADEIDGPTVETLRLALLIDGDERAADPSLSMVWREFEQRTATEQLAIALQLKELGAPDEVVFAAMPDIDQAEAARLARQNRGQALLAAAALPA